MSDLEALNRLISLKVPNDPSAAVPTVDPKAGLVFIVNASSGGSPPEDKRAAIEGALAEAGRSGDLRFTRPADLTPAADRAARTALQRHSAVVTRVLLRGAPVRVQVGVVTTKRCSGNAGRAFQAATKSV